MSKPPTPDTPQYHIGAVARLTGVPAHNLRMWERRYNVVAPGRSATGTRLYSQRDVERLSVIKRLVDSGQAISTVAALPLEALRERLDQLAAVSVPAAPAGAAPRRVLVISEALAAQPRDAALHPEGVEITVAADETALDAAAAVDVLVLERATVHEGAFREVSAQLRAAGASFALVVYRFGSSQALQALTTARSRPVHGPLTWQLLDRELQLLAASGGDAAAAKGESELPVVRPRLFSDSELRRLGDIVSSVRCECPQNLTALIRDLLAFEQYSAECESLNPGDAALHRYIHAQTASARAALEETLARVVEQENLSLD